MSSFIGKYVVVHTLRLRIAMNHFRFEVEVLTSILSHARQKKILSKT